MSGKSSDEGADEAAPPDRSESDGRDGGGIDDPADPDSGRVTDDPDGGRAIDDSDGARATDDPDSGRATDEPEGRPYPEPKSTPVEPGTVDPEHAAFVVLGALSMLVVLFSVAGVTP